MADLFGARIASARDALEASQRGAVISECGSFRYHLHRRWEQELPHLLFVMLNPSTADGLVDDATIRRCASFALAHGCGGFEVVNLFAYRATDPRDLRAAGWPVGPENNDWIKAAAEQAVEDGGKVVLAWGAEVATREERVQEVLPILRKAGADLHHLALTRSGFPRHPLYLPASAKLQTFTSAAIEEAMDV